MLEERELLRVRLVGADGDEGFGEAAPLEPYDGVPLGAVTAALDAYAAVLRDAAADAEPGELLAACAAERPLPQALAAIDLALWDRAGRRTGRPVAHLLAAGAASAVPVNATIGAEDRAGAAAQAAAAAAAGFGCVKVKVGVGDDAGRVAAVRAAVGPDVAVRVDANGAWGTPEEALANLRALAPSGLEYAEEPVHGVAALAAVRAESPVPVAMDETAGEPGAAGAGAADAVCLKIARCGGISGLLRDAAAARAAGSAVYVASSFDGPLGIAAGLHAAAALSATRPLPACGLATLGIFAGAEAGPAPARGTIAVPAGPGCSDPDRGGSAPGARIRPIRWSGARDADSEQLGERARLLEVRGVAGRGDDVDARGRDPLGHPPGDPAELLVALPHDEVDGHRELPQPLPQRRHDARAEPAQRRGEPGRRVAAAVGVHQLGDPARHPCEQRLGRPLARERVDADRLDPVGERGVLRRGAARARPGRRGPGSRRRARGAGSARRSRARRGARSGRPSSSRRA